MKENTIIFYAIERDEEEEASQAVVLRPGATTTIKAIPRETSAEVIEYMTGRYGEHCQYVSALRLEQILQQRLTHSPEMLNILQRNVMGDLQTYHVYGSYRPISAAWARIPDAVYIPVPGWNGTGYSTYVATPGPLEETLRASYELTFLSRPAPEEPQQDQA